jgi:hypothetical protein
MSDRIPGSSSSNPIRYGDWSIYLNDFSAHPQAWQVGWLYVHDDFDGADDANDGRCGACASVDACKAEIDDREADQADAARATVDSGLSPGMTQKPSPTRPSGRDQ